MPHLPWAESSLPRWGGSWNRLTLAVTWGELANVWGRGWVKSAKTRVCISRYVYRSQIPVGLGLIWGASQKERVGENTGVRRECAP